MGHGQGTGTGHKGGCVTDILKICTYCFVQKKKPFITAFSSSEILQGMVKIGL